ncbi:acyl--CoA ligase [Acetobacteraceae bacterium]|nr:acyl--CoA ligase [Acetobacteraceae bacterium]
MPDQFLACNAALYPTRIALESQGRAFSFGALEVAVQKLAGVLGPLKKQAPRLVAIDFEDSLYHWIVFLALARLSLPCCTLPPEAEGITEESLSALAPDFIITERRKKQETQAHEYLVLGAEWFKKVFQAQTPTSFDENISTDFDISEDRPFYVGLAGASVGGNQPVILNRRKVREVMSRLLWMDSVLIEGGARPIFVSTVHPSSLTGFLSLCSAFSSGLQVRFHDPANPAQAFVGAGPFVAILTPAHVAIVLESLEPLSSPHPNITLILGGGRASDRLLERCYAHFTPNVRLVYATDETGPIAMITGNKRIAPEHVGPILPWAQVKAVGENGEILPAGQTGEIWLKVTDGILSYQALNGRKDSYSGANARYFQNGWFLSGDRGKIILQNGIKTLWIEGRADDLVTLGGGKFDLAKIDLVLSEDPNVQEAGSFIYTDGDGRERLSCAVVAKEGCELDFKSLSMLFHGLYPGLPPLPIFRIKRLPRDSFGMVERHLLIKNAKGRIPQNLGGEA